MADRVGVMRAGKLEQVAAPAELYSRPATAFVAEFVGTMNRLPAELSGDGKTATVLGVTVPVQHGGPAAGRPTPSSARRTSRSPRRKAATALSPGGPSSARSRAS